MNELWQKCKGLFEEFAGDLDTSPGALLAFCCVGFLGLMTVAFIFMLIIATLYVVPVWLCWNWAAVPAFGAPPISFFQTYGLVVLCTLLLKSFNLNLNFGKK